jgi:hypothetical protein
MGKRIVVAGSDASHSRRRPAGRSGVTISCFGTRSGRSALAGARAEAHPRVEATGGSSMRTLVVYESMFGNTHAIAESIADGLRPAGEVQVVPVAEAGPELIRWADLVVAGGPTHVHGMTRELTRDMARGMAAKPEAKVTLDPAAAGSGVREWLDELENGRGRHAAAFDTRAQGAPFLTGRASLGIAHTLRSRGFKLVAEPESFIIDGEGHLAAGERDRARMWAAALVPAQVPIA